MLLEEGASDEEKENKMEFYRREITGKYHVPVHFVVETHDKNKPLRRLYPKKQGLEQKLGAGVGVVGILASLFFMSSNIMGNSIGSLNQNATNGVGIALFFIGLSALFFYFYKKR